MTFSAGLLSFALQKLGITILPDNPKVIDYLRLLAFVVCSLNILCWMWFPLQDLSILRSWVRTRKIVFPLHTSEFFAMLLMTVLLLFLIIASLNGAMWFGVVGAAVYVWNFIGFSLIRRKVRQGVTEARSIYSKAPPAEAIILNQILDLIEHYWSSAPTDHWLRNQQQLRHVSLAISFGLVAILGAIGSVLGQEVAYVLGIGTVLAAETSIAIWRTNRDRALATLRGQLRELES